MFDPDPIRPAVDWTAMRAQAQPVPAAQPVNDGMMRYERPAPLAAGSRALVFRADGTVDALDGFEPLDAPL